MGEQFDKLDPKLTSFIESQKIFFTATATDTSRVNISPRSTNLFRIVDDNTAIYLDKTGSGNETAAHLRVDGRMTVMFCALEGPPRILRLYGRGEVLHRDREAFTRLIKRWFDGVVPHGTRQIVKLSFDLVQTSCGYAVPVFEYKEERGGLDRWAEAKSPAQIEEYWRTRNQHSIDGLPTGIFDDTD